VAKLIEDVMITKLNLGCGRSKKQGYINLDSCDAIKPDVLWDLNKFPYPFEDNTFDEVLAFAILEHLDNTVKVMEELYRISKPNARVKIKVPYWASYGFATDPTHKSMFTEATFDYFTGKADYGFITDARFRILKLDRIYHPKLKWVPTFLKKRLRLILNEIVIGLDVELETVK